ncbi:MAG TPA: AbrB/MazE/SpoVT family DNA-binding domain-containing protein [Terriglobales bacterium]|jgi:AbrB family looped-hinge helix DNA binding protein|nr:AbrB/MazE/SpoVT family DNA-binding domain-containing protein [Terriglobales bacterium]
MKELTGTFTSKGQLVIPAELRRKHKIKAGTKVSFFEDELGRIIVQPITEEYIDRLMGCLSDGPDYLAIWEKEHRAEKDLSDKLEQQRKAGRARKRGSKQRAAQGSKARTRTSKSRDLPLA